MGRKYKRKKSITICIDKCLNGNIGHIVKLDNRHPKKSNSTFFRIDGCNSCDFKDYCKRWMNKKEENFKIFEVVIELQKYINQSEENLLSPKGIELRVNRSIQVEGTFGMNDGLSRFEY